MQQFKFLILAVLLICGQFTRSQVIYVDGTHGNNANTGTAGAPLASLEEAVNRTNLLDGHQPITIKVAPGLYTVMQPLIIRSRKDAAKLSVEAMVMPDDTGWAPAKMPVIQCVADSNRTGKLLHASIAFQIERNNVSIQGLKFTGNPNPASEYYYAIERRDSTLTGLEVSQCYFIGDRNSAPMQGGIFAQGANIGVDHCIFYGLKNAVLVFLGLKDFSLTHSIIYGAYEGAFWYGYGQSSVMPFTFSDNIVADGNYFFVGYRSKHTNYKFSNSLIAGNKAYMGFNEEEVMPDQLNKPVEDHVLKSGKVDLVQITLKGIPANYLNLSPSSAGADIDAGIFKKKDH
jgi:hypothetical protein